MIIHQIEHYPVIVTNKDNAKGYAILVTDYGPEAHKVWTIVLDSSGECWDVSNPFIRFQWNYSLSRTPVGLNTIKDNNVQVKP